MRLEHVEIRVQLFHKRRGDLDIRLIAPAELGWDQDVATLDSELFPPHREDYVESRYNNDPALQNPTDWTFTSVRHWGTKISTSPQWKLRVRDVITQGAQTNPTLGDPVYVPVGNPGQADAINLKMAGVGITWHGTFPTSRDNDPPTVTGGKYPQRVRGYEFE